MLNRVRSVLYMIRYLEENDHSVSQIVSASWQTQFAASLGVTSATLLIFSSRLLRVLRSKSRSRTRFRRSCNGKKQNCHRKFWGYIYIYICMYMVNMWIYWYIMVYVIVYVYVWVKYTCVCVYVYMYIMYVYICIWCMHVYIYMCV